VALGASGRLPLDVKTLDGDLLCQFFKLPNKFLFFLIFHSHLLAHAKMDNCASCSSGMAHGEQKTLYLYTDKSRTSRKSIVKVLIFLRRILAAAIFTAALPGWCAQSFGDEVAMCLGTRSAMPGTPNFDAEVALCESAIEARRDQAAKALAGSAPGPYRAQAVQSTEHIDLRQIAAVVVTTAAVLAALIAFIKLRVWRWRPRTRTARIAVVAFVGWSILVFVRTAGNIRLFGADLYRWDDDYFLLNWLLPPFLVAVAMFAYRWVSSAKPE